MALRIDDEGRTPVSVALERMYRLACAHELTDEPWTFGELSPVGLVHLAQTIDRRYREAIAQARDANRRGDHLAVERILRDAIPEDDR